MYRFTDYFDQNKIEVPYNGTEEEVQDYLRLLDMLLEGYLEYKGLASEEKLFSRGLVITESEMRNYFRKAPRERQRDRYDAALAEDVQAAWNYIESRTMYTVVPYGLMLPEDGVDAKRLLGDEEDESDTNLLLADEKAAPNTEMLLGDEEDGSDTNLLLADEKAAPDKEILLGDENEESDINLLLSEEEEENADSPSAEPDDRLVGTEDLSDTSGEVPEQEDGYEPDWEEEQPEFDEPFQLGILWIDSLRRIFDLDQMGMMAVIMALASVIDRKYDRIYGFLQDDISRTRPTVGLLAALMSRVISFEEGEDLLQKPLEERLFHSLFVIEEEESGLDTPLVLNPLMERILLGLPASEEQMPDPISIVEEDPDIPVFFLKSAMELEQALEDGTNAFCYVESSDEETVRHILASFCDVYNEMLFVFDLDHFMRMNANGRNACLADLILRVRLANGRVIVRMKNMDLKESGLEQEIADRRWKILLQLSKLLEESCIVLFGEEQEPGELIRRSVPFLKVPAPDVNVRTQIWTWFLQEEKQEDIEETAKEDTGENSGEDTGKETGDKGSIGMADDVVIEDLADCYDISYGTIKNTCSHAKAAARIRGLQKVDRELILESLRQLCQVDFSGLANYVRAAYTWDDIKINDDQRAVLKTACDRYRLRNRVGQDWNLSSKNAYGNGISLLLYGPPGTGKTMAAQVVANELGIPLYRVDISQIFSKYIGETEKNLSVIFDAAKGANVVLFFDEADALFSKRTEISNSNDKYANSETAYLLQKIEEYDGMSILATNHYNNFDPAFVRRITYSVRLDSPDEEARYTLWTSILPREAQLEEDIPFRFLAREFELSGANIKAILYSAAYMAGAEGSAIGTRHIVRAMEYEYRKLGRFIDRDAFGKYAVYLTTSDRDREEQ